jgi:hypothetical protein
MNQADQRKYESFAEGILDLDSRILSSIVMKNPGGAILAEAVRPELKNTLGTLSQRTDGMVGKWGILAYNALARLENARSKTKYLSVGRETTKGMLFPASIFEGVMIGLTIELKTEATEIYELVMKFVDQNIRLIKT